jgi:ubiquinone/menaquinone biosynthesis C-methylase UbiE
MVSRVPEVTHVAPRAALRRVAFEALYGPFAWAYDWVSRTFFLGQWRLWQRAAIRYLRGPKVLEVGMGTGDLQLDMARAGLDPWGVDLSPQMLRRARRKASRDTQSPLRACRARAQALPFPTGCFDSVVSTFPSDYIVAPETLAEIDRVLRPGGRLVIVPGGVLAARDSRSKLLERVAALVYGDKRSMEDIERRLRSSTQSSWVVDLKRGIAHHGFHVTTYMATNSKGAALLLVAEKRG